MTTVTEPASTTTSGKLVDRSLIREVVSYDFLVGGYIGVATSIFLFFRTVAESDVKALLFAMVAIDGGLIAISLTVLALLFAFTDREYHRLLEQTALGFVGALRPFVIVAVISTAGVAIGLTSVLLWTEINVGARNVLFSMSTGLTAWALVGIVELVFLLIWHAKKKSEWYGVFEQAKALLDQVRRDRD